MKNEYFSRIPCVAARNNFIPQASNMQYVVRTLCKYSIFFILFSQMHKWATDKRASLAYQKKIPTLTTVFKKANNTPLPIAVFDLQKW